MNAGDAIDGVGAHDAKMCHIDLLLVALLNEGHAPQPVVVPREEGGDALRGQDRDTAKNSTPFRLHTDKSLHKVQVQRAKLKVAKVISSNLKFNFNI